MGCPKVYKRALCHPDPYTVPTCAAWISAARGWAHKAGDGGTVYQPVVLDSFPQLCSIHRKPLINRLLCGDRFSKICKTFIRTSYTLTIHQYRSFSPCSNSIFAHCINQTNATSGFDPVTFFKISLRYNQWPKSNKNSQNWCYTSTSHILCIETRTNYKKRMIKNLCRKKFRWLFHRGLSHSLCFKEPDTLPERKTNDWRISHTVNLVFSSISTA